MKTLILILNLISFSVISVFAGNNPQAAPPDKQHTQIYYFSEVGYGKVIPLSGDRFRIICRGTAGTCWGISQENGRWYIDVFDGEGNMESWWLNAAPSKDNSDEEGVTQWLFDSPGPKE